VKTKLLIADSHSGVRELRRRLFVSCGFVVYTADGGVKCTWLLRDVKPHVLLLDTNLLWGGAEGVLAVLAEEWDARRVPVVLVGDCGRSPNQMQSGGYPVVAHLLPPIRATALIKSVQAAAWQSALQKRPDRRRA
jgi:DNA-binding NtrC family response regulator